jgi:uncharacterized repeat protein (TIGR01451 family)
VHDVPVGATCSVWETDTGGGVSDHALPLTAARTVITAQRNGKTSVVLANDFPQPPPVPAPPAGTPPADAQVLVTERVDHSSDTAGQPLIYTIQVENAGPAPATDVRLADSSSLAVALAGSSTSKGSCSGGLPLKCSLGTLAPGARAAIMVQERANTPGVLRDTVRVTDARATPTPATDVSAAVTNVRMGKTRLRIIKTPEFKSVDAHGTVTYRIRVQTVGPATALGVDVCDRLSAYLAISSAPGAHQSVRRQCWTIPALGPGRTRVIAFTVIAHSVPTLLLAPDTATATARNATAVRARAALQIEPKITPTPPPAVGVGRG